MRPRNINVIVGNILSGLGILFLLVAVAILIQSLPLEPALEGVGRAIEAAMIDVLIHSLSRLTIFALYLVFFGIVVRRHSKMAGLACMLLVVLFATYIVIMWLRGMYTDLPGIGKDIFLIFLCTGGLVFAFQEHKKNNVSN